jgi:hypothetical protein
MWGRGGTRRDMSRARLTVEEKAKVAAIREKSGYRKAIAEAKKLAK